MFLGKKGEVSSGKRESKRWTKKSFFSRIEKDQAGTKKPEGQGGAKKRSQGRQASERGSERDFKECCQKDLGARFPLLVSKGGGGGRGGRTIGYLMGYRKKRGADEKVRAPRENFERGIS